MSSQIATPSPLSGKEKISKKEKIIIWTGIGMVLFALLFALFFLVLPNALASKDQCLLGFGGNACPYTWMVAIGMPAFFVVGIPLIIIGLTLILWAVLKWKKVKNPGLTSFLTMVMLIILLAVILLLSQLSRWNGVQGAVIAQ